MKDILVQPHMPGERMWPQAVQHQNTGNAVRRDLLGKWILRNYLEKSWATLYRHMLFSWVRFDSTSVSTRLSSWTVAPGPSDWLVAILINLLLCGGDPLLCNRR